MAWEAFDVETSGVESEYALQPWRVKHGQAWLRSWAVATGEGNFPTAASHDPEMIQEQLRRLVDRWVEEETTVCVWNGPFDVAWLVAYGLYEQASKIKWMDGMLLWKHLTQRPEYDTPGSKRQSYGLKTAVAEYLPQFAGYDDGVDFDGPMLDLLHYNACDAWFTRVLTRYLYRELANEPKRLRAAKIESHCIATVARANYNGLTVDASGLHILRKQLEEQKAELLAELGEHGLTEEILGSPKQLSELLFDVWGLTPIKHGKTGPSTDKETLLELATFDDRMLKIQLYREAKGNSKKFVENVEASVDYNNDSRTHPQARIFGTYTGRFTYSSNQGKGVNTRQTGFALHQMKREGRYRALIRAPKGFKIVELDAAGQEFRWMAEISGDETMRHLCRPGEDPHAYMGSEVAGVDYKEVQEGAHAGDKRLKAFRQMGKVANLSLQFRTSAKTLLRTARIQHGMMDMTMSKAELVHLTYRRTYPGVPQYWARQTHFVKQHYYVETLAGRRVSVPKELVRAFEWSAESTSINYPIQGTGGDQKYLALSVIRPVLTEMDVTFLYDLHDGLYFLVPDEVTDDFIDTARALFNNLPYQKAWGLTPSIPLPWDVKVGDSWGNMVEL